MGEEEEVGGARHDRADPKAHAGRDGCVGVFRTCTHQSHRQEKEEAQVMLSHDTYGIPTFMVF